MGYQGQWNHATITWRRGVHAAFSRIFAESRRDRPASKTYRRFVDGKVQSTFFPRPGTTANYDPVMRALRKVSLPGTTRPVATRTTTRRSGSSSTRSTAAAGPGSPSG